MACCRLCSFRYRSNSTGFPLRGNNGRVERQIKEVGYRPRKEIPSNPMAVGCMVSNIRKICHSVNSSKTWEAVCFTSGIL